VDVLAIETGLEVLAGLDGGTDEGILDWLAMLGREGLELDVDLDLTSSSSMSCCPR
jgi:hypothetical protein